MRVTPDRSISEPTPKGRSRLSRNGLLVIGMGSLVAVGGVAGAVLSAMTVQGSRLQALNISAATSSETPSSNPWQPDFSPTWMWAAAVIGIALIVITAIRGTRVHP